MGACEHGAGWSSCPKGMTKDQMHDFAVTKESGLPKRKGKAKKRSPVAKAMSA